MTWNPRSVCTRELPGGFIVTLWEDGIEREFVRVVYSEAESLMARWMRRDIKDFKELGL